MPSFFGTGPQGVVTTGISVTSSTYGTGNAGSMTGIDAFALQAATPYFFEADIWHNVQATAAGYKFGLGPTSGAATATAFQGMILAYNQAVPPVLETSVIATTLAGLTVSLTSVTTIGIRYVRIYGYILVSAAGNFGILYAQGTTSATANLFLVGSSMRIVQMDLV